MSAYTTPIIAILCLASFSFLIYLIVKGQKEKYNKTGDVEYQSPRQPDERGLYRETYVQDHLPSTIPSEYANQCPWRRARARF